MRSATATKLIVSIFVGLTLLLALTGDRQEALGIAAMGLLIGGIFVGAWWFRDRPRADAYEAEAARLGLSFSARDPHDLLSLPHPLLHRASQMRGLENVSSGMWHARQVQTFEYWYQVGGGEAATTDYARFSCVLTPVPGSWPDLTIEHERLATMLRDAVGLRDIEFESERFNRAYDVRCDDPRFASALVDARMMEWLLAQASGAGFQIAEHRLLTFVFRVQPWEIESVLSLTEVFLERVPSAVADWYPGGSATV